jgi:ERCC4-related helicase
MDIKNKSNTELEFEKVKLKTEYESIRKELIELYDKWLNIEKEYNEISNELLIRGGLR